MSKCSKWESEGHSERIKANMVLNEPCFLNLYRRCIDFGRGSFALFSARARERATASWLVVEERENQRTKAKPHYKTQLNSKRSSQRQGISKAKRKYISPKRNRFAQNVRSPQDMARDPILRDKPHGSVYPLFLLPSNPCLPRARAALSLLQKGILNLKRR